MFESAGLLTAFFLVVAILLGLATVFASSTALAPRKSDWYERDLARSYPATIP